MKLNIFTFGKIKNKELKSITEYYLQLAGKYTRIDHIILKDVEEFKIRPQDFKIKPGFNVLLSERGKELNTIQFAGLLREKRENDVDINFYIANAFGFEFEVEQKANLLLAISKFTLAHEMCATILAEQIFRGLNLLSGGKYHK